MKHNTREKSCDGEESMLNTEKKKLHTKKLSNQKVSTISQNYNEKTMLLSSDDE
ncbi:hypothetical protein PGB90_005359 [Kerria lacca]